MHVIYFFLIRNCNMKWNHRMFYTVIHLSFIQLCNVNYFHFFFFLAVLPTACGILIPNQGSNPRPLQWKRGVLTTGQPRKSQLFTLLSLLLRQEKENPCFNSICFPQVIFNMKKFLLTVWLKAKMNSSCYFLSAALIYTTWVYEIVNIWLT